MSLVCEFKIKWWENFAIDKFYSLKTIQDQMVADNQLIKAIKEIFLAILLHKKKKKQESHKFKNLKLNYSKRKPNLSNDKLNF